MQIPECNICFSNITHENPAYFLDHEDNVVCGTNHIFDSACIEEIVQQGRCPFCRSNSFEARLLVPNPPRPESFYEKYKTNEMGDLAASSALMVGLQKVSSAVFNYIPIEGLGKFIGSSTAAAFGSYVSLLAAFGATGPFSWSSKQSLVNGVSMLAGLAATHFVLGFNDWGSQVGAVSMMTSGVANIFFSWLK